MVGCGEKKMAKFVVKIEYTGYKVFEFDANDMDEAYETAQRIENITNPCEERMNEEIVHIEKKFGDVFRSNNA
jgi:hypothetical protein